MRVGTRRTGEARLARRFAAHYDGPHAPEDALFWLEHPAERGPSGAPPPQAALQPLRDAVYRERAGDDDRNRYALALARLEADRAAAARARERAMPRPRRRRRRVPLVPALGVALGVLAIVAVGLLRSAGPLSTAALSRATASAAAGATSPAPADAGASPGSTTFAGGDGLQTIVVTEAGPIGEDPNGADAITTAAAIGSAHVDLPTVVDTHRVLVTVTCSLPATYSWVLGDAARSNGSSRALATSGRHPCSTTDSVIERTGDLGSPAYIQLSADHAASYVVSVREYR